MDLEQYFGREAGSGRDVAFEKNAKSILEGESSLNRELGGDREKKKTVAEENRVLTDETLTDQKKLRGKTVPNQLLQVTRN